MAKIGVIGAGSWGTALSRLLANNGHDVIVWSIIEAEVKMLQEKHEHVNILFCRSGIAHQQNML